MPEFEWPRMPFNKARVSALRPRSLRLVCTAVASSWRRSTLAQNDDRSVAGAAAGIEDDDDEGEGHTDSDVWVAEEKSVDAAGEKIESALGVEDSMRAKMDDKMDEASDGGDDDDDVDEGEDADGRRETSQGFDDVDDDEPAAASEVKFSDIASVVRSL